MVEIVYLAESSMMHRPFTDHPERPERALRAYESASRVCTSSRKVSVGEIDEQEALRLAFRIHARGYVEYLLRLAKNPPVLVDEDTYIGEDSLKLAVASLYYSYLLAQNAGGTPLFVVLRPPGHHAGRGGKAMGAPTQGFCLLNNAVAAYLGMVDRGFKKIAILDFDAHHGNGTMEILYDVRVLQIDVHQDPETLYPHTGYPFEVGRGEGYGYKANIIIPPGGGDDILLTLLDRVEKIFLSYNPDAVVVSAGFDAYANDGLADLKLTEASYYAIGRLLRSLSVPVVSVLEGGYSIGLEQGVLSFVEGLSGVPRTYTSKYRTPPLLFRRSLELADRVVNRVLSKVG